MVEVDPKLFVTCRLCLEVEGHFQIVPSVQQQIKYCFDIDVEPFDRLPQLICKTCENMLKEYYKTKKNFIEKQEVLKAKVQNNGKKENKIPSCPREESDSHSVDNSVKRKKKLKSKKGRKRIVNRLTSSSCDDLDDHDDSGSKVKHSQKEDPKPLDDRLCKYYVCRICSKRLRLKNDILEHLNEHGDFLKKYDNIFKAYCLVVLDKIESSSKVINNKNSVIYDSNSIIEQSKCNPHYYIIYHPKKYDSRSRNESQQNKHQIKSESDEDIPCKKRRRLSRSSSDTVVINQHSEHEDATHVSNDNNNSATVIDIIDINDSSDNNSDESSDKNTIFSNRSENDETNNVKSVENIIKMCCNKYVKALGALENKKVSHNKVNFLQHKVLSIGLKIINNKGFNCTGILRFTEENDLKVIWRETSNFNASNDPKYVRICPKMKRNDINNASKNLEWEVVKKLNRADFCKLKRRNNFLKKLNEFKIFLKAKNMKVNDEENRNSIEHMPRISAVFSNLDTTKIKTIDVDNISQKLLNTNPVSNPKQLPKKCNESTIKITNVFSGSNQLLTSFEPTQTDESNDVRFNTMPIVTSSISLAPINEDNVVKNGDDINPPTNSPQHSHYPRIKVKPVSELMPEKNRNFKNVEKYNIPSLKYLIRAKTDDDKLQKKTISKIIRPTGIVSPSEANKHPVINNVSLVSNTVNVAKEYVWLHSPDLPNMRTDSPFQYVKNLLLIHNITLLDSDAPLPPYSISLVKLNLAYSQDKRRPLILSLLLFCCKETFCIKLRDEHQKEVIISELTANWQWLVLNVYTKDVTSQILKSAAENGVSTLNNTQTFINVINSIHFSPYEICRE